MTDFDMILARHMLSGYRASSQKHLRALGLPMRQQQLPQHPDGPSRAKSIQEERSSPHRESQTAMATR